MPLIKYQLKKLRQQDINSCSYSYFDNDAGKCFETFFQMPELEYLINHKQIISSLSEKIIAHEFNLLGSGWKKVFLDIYADGREISVNENNLDWLGNYVSQVNQDESKKILSLIPPGYKPIDWQVDFRSGYRWNGKSWYKDIKYGHIHGPDIKIPWELGRMQHQPLLAYAARLSVGGVEGFRKPEVYLNEFRNQVLDFISLNPPRFGTQWMTSMDVAIRSINWIAAHDMFKSSGFELDTEFEQIFVRSIYEHGRHIINNLEWSSGMRGNHYLANITGLIFIASYLPVNEETTKWLYFGLKSLCSEINYQFYKDGGNFEASIYYHFLSSELMLYSVYALLMMPEEKILALSDYIQSNEPEKKLLIYSIGSDSIEFSTSFVDQLARIAAFAIAAIRTNGNADQIGDNDSGRLLKLYMEIFSRGNLEEDALNRIDILFMLRDLFHVDQTGYLIDKINPFIIKKNTKRLDSFSTRFKKSLEDLLKSFINGRMLSFPEFGIFYFRNDIFESSFRCGNIGQNGKGGHAHNDQLSVCITIKGQELIVDPGTYQYTGDWNSRNVFRSVTSHNTLIVDGLEQNTWHSESKDDLFWMNRDRAKAKTIEITSNSIKAAHSAYLHPHIREIEYNDHEIIGIDRYTGHGEKKILFHFNPDIYQFTQRGTLLLISANKFNVEITSDCGIFAIEDYRYSPGYGIAKVAKFLKITFNEQVIKWTIKINSID